MSNPQEFDVEYVILQGDDWCAGSSDITDAEHYAAVYGQDGPVQRQTAVTFTFDGFLDHDAILATLYTQPSKQTGGGGEERHAEEAAFLWGYAAGSGQDLGAGEDEWKRYLAALSTTEVAG